MTTKYQEIYQRSIKDAEGFWSEIANDIFWYKKPTKILNSDNPPFYKWFQDGTTNTCYNAVDLHVKNGKGEKVAIIYDSPITNSQKKITYAQLKEQVSIFAGALVNQGIKKGDSGKIYMPMIAEGMVRQFTFGGGVASGAAGFYPPSLIEQINRLGNRADEWPDTAKAITMLGAWVAKTYGGRIYGKGQNLKRQAIAHYAELFEEWDLLLTPHYPWRP